MADSAAPRSESRGRRGPLELCVEGAGSELRLDRWLRKRYPRLPRGLLHKLARQKRLLRNGTRAAPETKVRDGDRIEVWSDLSAFGLDPDHHERRARELRRRTGFRRHFRLLHEDDAIIVLDKPAGLVVHPDRHHRRGDTLLDLLEAYLPAAFASDSPFRPAFVHRLDRGTSGVIVAARTHDAARRLEETFRTRAARKRYRALVAGRVAESEGRIELPIGSSRTASGVTRFRAAPDEEAARADGTRTATTTFRVLGAYRRATLLEVEPGSGRTHQIRVHLASAGHPIVGDGDYGRRGTNREMRRRTGLARTFLHAAELEIPHPSDGERRTFRAPLPPELRRVLDALER